MPDELRWFHLDGTECVSGWWSHTGECTTGGGPVTPRQADTVPGIISTPELPLLTRIAGWLREFHESTVHQEPMEEANYVGTAMDLLARIADNASERTLRRHSGLTPTHEARHIASQNLESPDEIQVSTPPQDARSDP